MDYKQIQELIKLVNKMNISELKISENDFSITIRANDYISTSKKPDPIQQIHVAAPIQSVPAQAETAAPTETAPGTSAPPATKASSDEDKYDVFRSPMIGTFYRKPGPGKDVFVNVDDIVKPGDVLCIIEAMKLFNEIEFEGNGRIVKILVEDATPVEYDQPLFLIEPIN